MTLHTQRADALVSTSPFAGAEVISTYTRAQAEGLAPVELERPAPDVPACTTDAPAAAAPAAPQLTLF